MLRVLGRSARKGGAMKDFLYDSIIALPILVLALQAYGTGVGVLVGAPLALVVLCLNRIRIAY